MQFVWLGEIGVASICSIAEGFVFDFKVESDQHELERMMASVVLTMVRQFPGQKSLV
ncbi:hypothetical protein N9L68_02100 [bacterium]|nr:hypothetical protein [bacterium]